MKLSISMISQSTTEVEVNITFGTSIEMTFEKFPALRWPQCKGIYIKGIFHIPISLLALAEAGYNTLHLFPFFGSSEARTLPVATTYDKILTHLCLSSNQHSEHELSNNLNTIDRKTC